MTDPKLLLLKAMFNFQKEVKAIHKESKGQYGEYAGLPELLAAIKEPLANNGLLVTQFPTSEMDENGNALIGIETTVYEITGGAYMAQKVMLPVSGVPNKNVAQAAGSLLTYLRRYSLTGALSLGAIDDDAEQLTPLKTNPKPIGVYDLLKAAIKGMPDAKEIAQAYCEEYGVRVLSELTEAQMAAIVKELSK